MSQTPEEKPKKKGFFALVMESITKTSEGCGPSCGCHAVDKPEADDKAERAKGGEVTQSSKKN